MVVFWNIFHKNERASLDFPHIEIFTIINIWYYVVVHYPGIVMVTKYVQRIQNEVDGILFFKRMPTIFVHSKSDEMLFTNTEYTYVPSSMFSIIKSFLVQKSKSLRKIGRFQLGCLWQARGLEWFSVNAFKYYFGGGFTVRSSLFGVPLSCLLE